MREERRFLCFCGTTTSCVQALSALLFLYRHVLGCEIGDLGEVIRARKPKRLPVVMTREEAKAVVGASLKKSQGMLYRHEIRNPHLMRILINVVRQEIKT